MFQRTCSRGRVPFAPRKMNPQIILTSWLYCSVVAYNFVIVVYNMLFADSGWRRFLLEQQFFSGGRSYDRRRNRHPRGRATSQAAARNYRTARNSAPRTKRSACPSCQRQRHSECKCNNNHQT